MSLFKEVAKPEGKTVKDVAAKGDVGRPAGDSLYKGNNIFADALKHLGFALDNKDLPSKASEVKYGTEQPQKDAYGNYRDAVSGRYYVTFDTWKSSLESEMKDLQRKAECYGKIADSNYNLVYSDSGRSAMHIQYYEKYTAAQKDCLTRCREIQKMLDGGMNEFYLKNGELRPQAVYEFGDTRYITDAQGRIIRCEATPKLAPENSRDLTAQRMVGGDDRKLTDNGGHLIARELGGDSGLGNLVAMDERINKSDYKRMESDVKNLLSEGKEVSVSIKSTYAGDSRRPDMITATVRTEDGKTLDKYKFDNNLDNSLIQELPSDRQLQAHKNIEEKGGAISSVKYSYDAAGNLIDLTLQHTYEGADGKTYRCLLHSD